MNPRVKMERKCNESLNNEFKIMRKSNSLHQIMRENIAIRNGKIVWNVVWMEYYLRLNLSSRRY